MMNETRVPLIKQPPRFWFICYNLILQLFSGLIRVRSRNDPDLQEALEGRQNLWERLETSLKSRIRENPWSGFTLPVRGEWLQAQPVIRRLSETEVQCADLHLDQRQTMGSGNGRKHLQEFWSMSSFPWTPQAMRKDSLDLMAPDKIVWVSYDLWPNHVWEAAHREIPQLLISGIVHQASARSTNFIAKNLPDPLQPA